MAGPEEAQLHPSSPGQEAGAARRGAGGGRQDALRCEAGAPGWRAREAGTRVARDGGVSRQRGNPGRGREGRGRVQMRSRRWMKVRQDLRREAEEAVGGRKG